MIIPAKPKWAKGRYWWLKAGQERFQCYHFSKSGKRCGGLAVTFKSGFHGRCKRHASDLEVEAPEVYNGVETHSNGDGQGLRGKGDSIQVAHWLLDLAQKENEPEYVKKFALESLRELIK